MSGEAARILNAGEAMKPPACQQTSCSGIPWCRKYWHQFAEQLRFRAHQVSDASNWEGFWPGSGVAFLCSE